MYDCPTYETMRPDEGAGDKRAHERIRMIKCAESATHDKVQVYYSLCTCHRVTRCIRSIVWSRGQSPTSNGQTSIVDMEHEKCGHFLVLIPIVWAPCGGPFNLRNVIADNGNLVSA